MSVDELKRVPRPVPFQTPSRLIWLTGSVLETNWMMSGF